MVGISDATQVLVLDSNGCFFRKERALDAQRWIAGCTLDPQSLDELIEGWKSFCVFEPVNRRPSWKFMADLPDLDAWSGQQIWIDLGRRAIWIDCPKIQQQSTGRLTVSVPASELNQNSDLVLGYHLPSTWLITDCRRTWEQVAREQHRWTISGERGTVRSVLYEQVVDFIAEQLAECRLASRTVRNRWRPPTDWKWQELPSRAGRKGGPDLEDLFAEIHARWLMTARDDLNGMSPRACLLLHRDFVDSDLWEREQQWNLTGKSPAPMSREVSRYDGPFFGTHEIVMYYELVRELLRCTASYYLGSGLSSPASIIPVLHRYRENWLATPAPDSASGVTPKFLIDLERRRMPWLMSQADIPFDCECPICQMMAETPGLTFGHFDGSSLDFEWAFSLTTSREDWEQENEGFPWASTTGYESEAEESEETFAPPRPSPGPTIDELGAWPLDVLLLYVATEIRSLVDQSEKSDESSIRSRELMDGFAQLHECALDPGWVDSQTRIVRMFKTLTFWESTAGESPELFSLATALDVLSVKLSERQDLASARLEKMPQDASEVESADRSSCRDSTSSSAAKEEESSVDENAEQESRSAALGNLGLPSSSRMYSSGQDASLN